MAKTMRPGEKVYKCGQLQVGRCHGKGWHIQTYHSPTGMPWSEENCPLYGTKRAALEAVVQRAREEG